MKDLTLGDRSKYHSQLDNKIDPYISCQCTAMVMGLDIANRGLKPIEDLAFPDLHQPEDKLRRYMTINGDVNAFCEKSHPGSKIHPSEWADVMVSAINRLYGKETVYFDGFLTDEKIDADISWGLPIYTSMRYPDNKQFSGKPFPVAGHIVLIVGCYDDGGVLINDPYKNHLTGEPDGFCNHYTREQFGRHNKGFAIQYFRQ